MKTKNLGQPAAEVSMAKQFMALGRRQTRRLLLRVPMRIRSLEKAEHTEERVESMNISLRGTYFPTTQELEVGPLVEIRFKMPGEIVPGQKNEWTFTGRVVHREELGRSFDRKFGVGVYFLYYSAH